MAGRRIMRHVTSPEKMHRGAIAPYWIITAWIGILSSGAFPLPSHHQACRARPRPPRLARARARRPARTYATLAATWACQPACTTATPAPGMAAGPLASTQVCGHDPGRVPGTRPGTRAWAREPACTSANIEPGTRVGRPAYTGTPLGPAGKGGEENNGARHLARKNA